jgi:Fe2+ transport system protein B
MFRIVFAIFLASTAFSFRLYYNLKYHNAPKSLVLNVKNFFENFFINGQINTNLNRTLEIDLFKFNRRMEIEILKMQMDKEMEKEKMEIEKEKMQMENIRINNTKEIEKEKMQMENIRINNTMEIEKRKAFASEVLTVIIFCGLIFSIFLSSQIYLASAAGKLAYQKLELKSLDFFQSLQLKSLKLFEDSKIYLKLICLVLMFNSSCFLIINLNRFWSFSFNILKIVLTNFKKK